MGREAAQPRVAPQADPQPQGGPTAPRSGPDGQHLALPHGRTRIHDPNLRPATSAMNPPPASASVTAPLVQCSATPPSEISMPAWSDRIAECGIGERKTAAVHRARGRHAVAHQAGAACVLDRDMWPREYHRKVASVIAPPRIRARPMRRKRTLSPTSNRKGRVGVVGQNPGGRSPDDPPSGWHQQRGDKALRPRDDHRSRRDIAHRGRLAVQPDRFGHAAQIGIAGREAIHRNTA